jgi:hypothetical protein
MNFDIDSSPLPSTLVDSNGNPAEKQFDCISVSSVYTSDTLMGHLSDEVPEIVGLTPAEYDESHYEIADRSATIPSKYLNRWHVNTTLSDPFISTTTVSRLQFQTDGSSLNPTQKDGSTLYDPEISEESISDCEFVVNVGALSPYISVYSNTLTYYYNHLTVQEYVKSIIPWNIGIKVNDDSEAIQTVTRQTGVVLTNRYIHTTINVVFTIWTSYKIEVISGETVGLLYPEEYYDKLIYDATVDGVGGGTVYTEGYSSKFIDFGDLFGSLGSIITIIIIIIVIAVGLYVFVKVGVPYLKKRSEQNKGCGTRQVSRKY